ncbi:uncharacterized protein MONBRDRAFT_33450 [Monosiga brevicollis MX1]|uniref:RRM domain-containing protein n=1 Tax=Monosiga brevicollis TaxID=81824 RepID=A9V5G8_MONBE|nr:uncharacterized protein MONBRDRAFT_33450 [Monosiga brevicollis MX1]EDQ87368.1 predicted protein [Monosiga brevicollis MX1]|eukprot:XP_001747981.1 hypothetical protein [Monosiga brevicollis MX1]
MSQSATEGVALVLPEPPAPSATATTTTSAATKKSGRRPQTQDGDKNSDNQHRSRGSHSSGGSAATAGPPRRGNHTLPATSSKHTLESKLFRIDGMRVLLVSNALGHLRAMDSLAQRTTADFVLHVGNFGFYDNDSAGRVPAEHLLPQSNVSRDSYHNGLGEFPLYLSGRYKFQTPVYAISSPIGDVHVLCQLRSKAYQVPNFHMVDEMTSHLIGKLRLLGLGGEFQHHRLLNSGDGTVDSIAGAKGQCWSTLMQVGELVQLADKYATNDEIRIFLCNESPAYQGYMAQLASKLKASIVCFAAPNAPCPSNFYLLGVVPPTAIPLYTAQSTTDMASFWDKVPQAALDGCSEAERSMIKSAFELSKLTLDNTYAKSVWHIAVPGMQRACATLLVVQDFHVGLEAYHHGDNLLRKREGVHPRHQPGVSAVVLRPAVCWDNRVQASEVRALAAPAVVLAVDVPHDPEDKIVVFVKDEDAEKTCGHLNGKEFKGTEVRASVQSKRDDRGSRSRGGRGGRGNRSGAEGSSGRSRNEGQNSKARGARPAKQ